MSHEMTIDSVLSDPMIRAVMRADHVEPQAFERLLLCTATKIGKVPRERSFAAVPNVRVMRAPFAGFCCA